MKAETDASPLSDMSDDELEWLREAGKNDLYVLAKGILGYPDINKATHGAYCRFIQTPPDGKLRSLGLMPRGHLKSTIATIADSIRVVLQDPDHARVLVANETSTLAKKFVSEIKGHWEKNELLRGLYPELVPRRWSGPGVSWSDEQASLVRGSAHKEPNWSAVGVGGASVGAHFTKIKCDDLIGFDASQSPAAMQYAISWNGNIESLLVDQHVDQIDWIGTRWAKNDLYSHLMREYGQDLAVFTRSAIEDGQIIFPEKHTWEEYRRLQENQPAIWASQYENAPRSQEKKDFNDAALRTFRLSDDGSSITGGFRNEIRWRVDQLDICLLADPNSGDKNAPDTAAKVVVGVSPKDQVFALHASSGRPSASEFVDSIFELWKRWKPRVVGIEKAGQQNTLHYFEKKSKEEGINPRVVPLTHRNRNKIVRIRTALEPIITSGRLFLLPSQTTLRGQIVDFPDTLLIDEVDVLSYGPEVWKQPLDRVSVEEAKVNIDALLANRNPRTGY
jgi:hypothetical protein